MRTGACLWAFSLLLGLGAAGSVAPPPAAAQQAEAQAFEIAPQPLSSALLAFAEQTGLEVLFDARIAQGKTSPGVQGSYAPEQALRRLIAGSGLRYRFTSASTITLERDAVQEDEGPIRLAPVTVTGERVERTVFDTASSVAVITSDEIEERHGDRTIKEVIEDVPNVFNVGTGVAPFIRGQDTQGPNERGTAFFGGTVPRASFVIDGRALSFLEYVNRTSSAFDVERIEVFRGPQTTAQGPNSIAGAFYIQTKDPTFEPELILEGQGGSFDRARGSGALSGPIIGDELAGRIALDYQRYDTFVDYTNPSFVAEPASTDFELFNARAKLLWEPAALPDLQAKLTYNRSFSEEPQDEDLSKPFDDLENSFTPSIGSFRTNTDSVIFDASYDVSNNITLTNQFQYSDSKTKRFFTNDVGNAEFDLSEFVNEARANFDALHGRMSGVLGLYYRSQDSDEFLEFFGDSDFDDQKTSFGSFAEISYDLTDRLTVLGGIRYQRDSVERTASVAVAGVGDVAFDRTFDAVLPRVSVSYDITPDVKVGALVSRGYNPGGVALSFTRAEFVEYDEETLWNYELFSRASLLDERLFLSANAFYTDITDAQRFTSVPIPGAAFNDSFTLNAEEARTYGLEVSVDYQVTDRLRVFGGVGLLETEFVEFTDAAEDFSGNAFESAPNYSLSGGFKWEAIDGLTLGGRVRHTDGVFSDDENTGALKTDPVTLVDLDLAFEPIEAVTLFGYVNNVLDEVEPLRLFDSEPVTAKTTRPREFGIGVRLSF